MPSTVVAGSIEPQSLKKLSFKSLKRTYDFFGAAPGEFLVPNSESKEIRVKCKVRDEYAVVRDLPQANPAAQKDGGGAQLTGAAATGNGAVAADPPLAGGAAGALVVAGAHPFPSGPGINLPPGQTGQNMSLALLPKPEVQGAPATPAGALATPGVPGGYQPSAAVMKRLPSKWPRPVWHPPWKTYRVISGHLGWVRSVAFDPANQWFVTGSADRTIKIWDLASGKLKLTLTGHIEQIRGLAISPRHPYMFSAGDDKMVKCWDLEQNKVIRSYHGHLSGVYCLALHPTLDILMTGGRDSACRVWDMRTKQQIFCLTGHDNTVCSVVTQPTDPQVITGSHDATIKLWDLRLGKTMSTLTYHKKSVRSLVQHPAENTFCSASADNVKKFKLPRGDFLHNMLSYQRTIINCMAVNEEGVLATGGDNGSIWFWDWKSGHNFQQTQTVVQPGSLDSEAGIYAIKYDQTGSRLVTCEADKTIKMWKEDERTTPESHPVNFKPPKDMRRF